MSFWFFIWSWNTRNGSIKGKGGYNSCYSFVGASGFLFGVGTQGTAVLREKDDIFNYAVGGALAGLPMAKRCKFESKSNSTDKGIFKPLISIFLVKWY